DPNIKLLAWLIEFMPFEVWRNQEGPNDSKDKITEGDVTEDNRLDGGYEKPDTWMEDEKPGGKEAEPKEQIRRPSDLDPAVGRPTKTIRKRWIYVLTAVIAGSIIYMLVEHYGSQCMYWTGSEYKQTTCTEKINGAEIIAADKNKLKHLRRIVDPEELAKR